jgi:hypothetical protein
MLRGYLPVTIQMAMEGSIRGPKREEPPESGSPEIV